MKNIVSIVRIILAILLGIFMILDVATVLVYPAREPIWPMIFLFVLPGLAAYAIWPKHNKNIVVMHAPVQVSYANSKDAKKCKFCRAPIETDTRTCPKCGAPV